MNDDGIMMLLGCLAFFGLLYLIEAVLERLARRHRSDVPHPDLPRQARSVSLPAISTAQAERQRRAFDDAMARMRVELDHDRKVAATLERLGVRTENEMNRRSER